jgi:hypothetical protein
MENSMTSVVVAEIAGGGRRCYVCYPLDTDGIIDVFAKMRENSDFATKINEINVELSENLQRYVNECCESESDGKIDGFRGRSTRALYAFPASLGHGALSWRCLGGISRGGVSQNA